jgi:16S rRNA processing protein RimM
MNPADFEEIGYFQKPHGYKGQIGLAITSDKEILFDKIQFVMLEINNLLTPFFLEKIEAKHKVLVKLENCNSDVEAKKFQGKKVFLAKNLLVKPEEEEEEDYSGYLLIDETHGELGPVESIEEMPGNDVFVVRKDGKEILLPVLEDFIEEIDDEARVIRYKAPDGLIELYLE